MAEHDALAAIRGLLPDECLVRRTVEVSRTVGVRCTDYVGGVFADGATFTEDMCCLPCRIKAVIPPEVEPVRVDAGDRDAALARVDIYSKPDDALEYEVMCDCGWTVISERNLLELVNLVAEHQPTCSYVRNKKRELT